MIIASVSLLRYESTIAFPVKVLDETGQHEVLEVSANDFRALVETNSVIGIGTYATIKSFRLNRPLCEVNEICMRFLSRPPRSQPVNYKDKLKDIHSVQVIKRSGERHRSPHDRSPLPVPTASEYHRWDNLLQFKEMKAHPKRLKSEDGTVNGLAAYRRKHGEIGGGYNRRLRNAARELGIPVNVLHDKVYEAERKRVEA